MKKRSIPIERFHGRFAAQTARVTKFSMIENLSGTNIDGQETRKEIRLSFVDLFLNVQTFHSVFLEHPQNNCCFRVNRKMNRDLHEKDSISLFHPNAETTNEDQSFKSGQNELESLFNTTSKFFCFN